MLDINTHFQNSQLITIKGVTSFCVDAVGIEQTVESKQHIEIENNLPACMALVKYRHGKRH